ncbi:hypothetical protein ACFFQF_21440 [Haladaptatus pallidirubidus]|uniref:hypothetical protein n=1 Tax=Haladaptatus pallidirubidus TaxID=1008152 RepID=UPI001D10BAC4|nr:hypothetical protein [Haladaptatus pallidirubidus]
MSRQTKFADGAAQRTLTECTAGSTERDDTPTTEHVLLDRANSMRRTSPDSDTPEVG